MTFAGCDVGCVLQIAGVVTPCLQRIQDAVSVVAISSGGRQTAGVIGQLGPMLGEKGLLCEGDGGHESCVACLRALVAEEGLDSREDHRSQVPKRAHPLVLVEEPLASGKPQVGAVTPGGPRSATRTRGACGGAPHINTH